ncbi:hypothetical protein JHK87_026901 [Glycine soja]|nr:hypothetical protein JHK87_026901 [Glycine soja]
MMLRTFVGKIEMGISQFVHRRPPLKNFNESTTTSVVPDDVREGYFAVLGTKGGESKRFVVSLHYLNDPAFLGLLDQAQEEFGFRKKGALSIPCQPQEFLRVAECREEKQQSCKGYLWRILLKLLMILFIL